MQLSQQHPLISRQKRDFSCQETCFFLIHPVKCKAYFTGICPLMGDPFFPGRAACKVIQVGSQTEKNGINIAVL